MATGRYQLVNASVTASGTGSVQLLPFDVGRNFLLLENLNATNDVWVNLAGGTASVAGSGCILLKAGNVPNSRIVFESSVPAGPINVACSGSAALTVITTQP